MTRNAVVGIDHVELFVPDRRTAAKWYEEALGLSVMAESFLLLLTHLERLPAFDEEGGELARLTPGRP